MGIIDIVLLVLFIPGITQGFARGLVNQVIALVSIVVSAVLASRFAQNLADWALTQFPDMEHKLMFVICFAVIFFTCLFLLGIVGNLVTKLINTMSLGFINRLLGALFSLIITAFVLGLIISIFEGLNTSWAITDPDAFKDLKVWPKLRDFAGSILPQLKLFVSDYVAPAATSAAEQCANV